jgi:hypothetical protein
MAREADIEKAVLNKRVSQAPSQLPASSPAFNYAFRREDDTIKPGVNFYFGPAPVPAAPAYPVKAPMLK